MTMVSLSSDEESKSNPDTTQEANTINGGALSSTASSSSSRSQQGIAAPAPFLTKTYEMINDSTTDPVVSWGAEGSSFVVWNPPEFARDLLPRYFKHNNFASFVRQLNTYGFRKVDPDKWEFANEGFLRGQRDLLKGIHRRKPSTTTTVHNHGHMSSATPGISGKPGLEAEVEKLNRDKNVLMLELVRLRQQQQQAEQELHHMGQRLQGTERRQQHMISFLAKAIQSPAFLAQVLDRHGCSSRSVKSSNHGTVHQITGHKRKQLQLSADGDNDDDDDTTSADQLKMIKYDPDPETLVRFFSRPDVASWFDAPLQVELLVQELVREHEEKTSNSPATQTCSGEGKSSLEEEQKCSPPPLRVTEVTETSNEPTPEVTETSNEPTPELTLSLDSHSQPTFEPEVHHATVDSGAVGVGFNDVFWERFLTDADGTSNKRGEV